MLRLAVCVLALPLLAGCATAAGVAAGPAPGPTEPEIEAEDLRLRVGILAHDSLRGRETGTPGAAAAARYLSAELARLGLRPAGDNGGYLQRVPLRRTLTTAEVDVQLASGGASLGVTEILPVSGLGGLPTSVRTSGSGPIVYAGHLIDPEVGANELTLDQVRNAVLIVRLSPPAGVDPSGAGPRMPVAAAFSPASPAAAVLLVAEETEEEFWDYTTEVGTKGALALASSDPPAPAGNAPPFFLISEETAERLIGGSLTDARMPRTGLGTLTFSTEERVSHVDGFNVAAIFPGRDPARAQQYVGLGAHFDHVGIGAPVDGDSIYNGADDNASGTSALLEVAEALAHLPAAEQPARSVLIVWNAAEESGLLGSEHFTDNPTVPRESIIAHVNMDMIGRNDPDSLGVVGSRRLSTELGDLLEEVNRAQEDPFIFDYTYDAPGHPEQIYCRSDHYNYARYGIPVIFLSTGLHDQYHQPSDEADLLDYEKAERVSELVYDLTLALGNRPSAPTVDKPVPPPGTPCS